MRTKLTIAAVAALTVAASAMPALAQGGHRSYHDGWASGSPGWDYDGFAVGVGFGNAGPGIGVRVGPDDAGPYAYAPRYRSSSYAWGNSADDYAYVGSSYPGYAYSDYGYAGYDDGGYVTAGVGWSDDGWRNRRFSRSSYDRGYRTVSRSSTRLNARASTGISERSGANVRVGTTGRSERMNMRASGNAEIRGGANMRTEGSAMRTAPNRSGTVRASTDVRSSGTVGMSRRSGSNGDSSR